MKSKLGITLRKVRKGKQMSICSLADEYLSKSQISRFERGESEISCARLINILNKLHITLDEFLILHDKDDAQTESFANLVHYIRKQYSVQNFDKIKTLLSNSSNYTLNHFERTMVKSILHTVDSKEMLNNHIFSSLNKTNKRIVSQLAINCFILSIDKEEFSNCSYLIDKIRELLDNELNFYEQTVFLYATGYYEFKRQSCTGIEKMKQAIKVLDILGEDKLKLHYTDHFNKLVNRE